VTDVTPWLASHQHSLCSQRRFKMKRAGLFGRGIAVNKLLAIVALALAIASGTGAVFIIPQPAQATCQNGSGC
jgi:hypothetical protein